VSLALLSCSALGLLCAWGLVVTAPYRLQMDEREFSIEGLASEWDGLRIFFLGDLHMRRWGYRETWVLDRIRRCRPDLIVSTGDLVESDGVEAFCEWLSFVNAPLGFYMVPGNNENLEHDTSELFPRLQLAGVTVLVNEWKDLGHGFRLVGVDDPSRGRDDIEKACQGLPEDGVALLLAHTPELFLEAAERDMALVVAGHTHGGQIRFPGIGALWTDTPRTGRAYDCGLFESAGTKMLLTRGIGVSKLPIRLLCSPEVHLLTLRA